MPGEPVPFRPGATFTEVMYHLPRTPTSSGLPVARLADASAGPIIAGGRLLDSVADRDLQGTLHDIARPIRVRSEDLVAAMAELSDAGWVTIRPDQAGAGMLRLANDAR